MFSFAELKYSKRFTVIILGIISALIMIMTIYFYIFRDLTALSRFDVGMWLVVGLLLKLLFKDSMMKWLFNVITVCNVGLFVMILSYPLSRVFPYPMYTNTILRVILYVIFMILFKRLVYPLYRQVVDRWQQFLLVTVGMIVNYIYILLSSDDITQAIMENLTLLLLFSVLMFLVYGTIFWSFRNIIREYEFYRFQEQAMLHKDLLYSQLAAHEEFVEVSKHHRHDLRHHNQIVMEYIKLGDVEGAVQYLQLYDKSLTEAAIKEYCKHHIANVLLGRYAQKAQEEGITFTAKVDIPEILTISQPEIGGLLSNLLENALEACQNIKTDNTFIMFIAVIEEGMLKIELKNSVGGNVEIINNLPVSTKKGGGIGTKSMQRIVETHYGMIYFKQEGQIFITQVILPIE